MITNIGAIVAIQGAVNATIAAQNARKKINEENKEKVQKKEEKKVEEKEEKLTFEQVMDIIFN